MSADAIADGLRRDLTRAMTQAGLVYVSEARSALNAGQPYRRTGGGRNYRGLAPSLPGQMPKKLTGQLQRSMAFEVAQTADGPVLYLGSSMRGHPAFLQLGTPTMAPRPWLTLVWQTIQARVTSILTGGR